jgi:protein-disulfide isomerase
MVLSVIGIIIATALTFEHFNPKLLPCGLSAAHGCTGTLQSSYGHVGPIPTAIIGLGMYIVLLVLCIKREAAFKADEQAANASSVDNFDSLHTISTAATPSGSRVLPLTYATFGISGAAFCISWWLQYEALWEIRSFCPYCFASACTVTLIAACATYDFLKTRTLNAEQRMLLGVIGFVAVMGLFMVVPDALQQIDRLKMPDYTPTPVTEKQIPRDKILLKGLPIKGDPKAKYTLVEFADYQCPSCKKAVALAEQIVKDNPDVKLEFRNYPLPQHKHALMAAKIAEAASLQGKFWQAHDTIYAHQSEMEVPTFNDNSMFDWVKDLGLDMTKLVADARSQAIDQRVNKDIEEGALGGISLTPSFFFVSPDQVYRFAGPDDIKLAIKDRTHPMWK